jgi:PAS domain S-box-containing protein
MTKPKTILVAEDDPSSREYLVYLLEQSGYKVRSAEDGVEALDKVGLGIPDLIVSDILMPRMDGIQLLQKLRSQPSTANIPVIFYSGSYGGSAAQQLVDATGAAQHVTKPADPQVILKAIQDALEQPQSTAPQPAFDSSLFPEQQVRVLSEELMRRVQELTAANAELDRARGMLEEEIVSRKRLEADLRESESRLLQITSHAPVGIYQTNAAGECVFVNDWWLSVTGLPLEECLGWGWTRAIHHEDRAPAAARAQRLMTLGADYYQEFRMITGSGEARWVMSRAVPVRARDGQINGYVGMVLDIHDRKQAAATLLKSEEQYRLLFEGNPNPMWVFDLETLRFLAVNRAAVANYGYSKREFLEMVITDIRPASDLARLVVVLEESNEGSNRDQTAPHIGKHKRKDGSILDVEIISHLITFEGRSAKLVLAHDVTERRSMEAQLRQAQKMEAIGQLASGVAHDFNNLLGIIMGCTELSLLRLEEGSPIAKKLLDVKAAAQRATGLTRQLLLFSRQEISEPRKVDLNSTVAASERFLRRLIHENVEIACALSEDRPAVTIDPGHLEQVLMNLVVNARDAMPQGGQIRIETRLADLSSAPLDTGFQPREGHYALLTVSDTGQGMDETTKARIFEPFFTTKERGKGTGLGLATVHGIVKQAGGHVTVYSEVGRGTVFKIFLPLSSSPAEQPGEAETAAALRGNATILLVEDEPALRSTIRDFLEESGYKVLEGGNGLEAIAVAEQHHGAIEMLLSDVIMPGMSGAELLDRLLVKYPDLQVLLMTGYTDDVLVRQGMTRSAGLIQKPFTGYALLQKIHSVLSARKMDSKQHTILVADDDPVYKELMADMLRSSGFEVLVAKDGAQAVMQDLTRRFDLAVLDVQMPRQNGLAVCKQLRSDPATALIPIIAVSGLTSSDTQQLAMDAGANVFLRKPVARDDLLTAVNTLLDRAKTTTA